MKKEEFLNKLKTKLDIFTEKEQENILNNYQKLIENDNLSEEESIKKLGSIEKIYEDILLNHGINPKRIKKETISKKLEELFKIIQNIVEQMSKNNMKENAKIIMDLLVLLFLICIIKLPFIFIRNIGDTLLLPLEKPILLNIWSIVLDIIYIIVAVMVFINIFTKWFKLKKDNKTESLNKIKNQSLEAITLEEKK